MALIILDNDRHRVTSWGNGCSYLVKRHATGEEFHLQGEEAVSFCESVFEQDVSDFSDAIELLYGECFHGGQEHQPLYPLGSRPASPAPKQAPLKLVHGGKL